MSFHAFLDRMTVRLSALAFRGRGFFSRGVEGPGIREHIESTEVRLPAWKGEGLYEAEAVGIAGGLDPGFLVARYEGPGHPTVLYHHGNNERPFNMSFKTILMRDPKIKANLVCLRAPYHAGTLRDYLEGVSTVSGFCGMMAASVRLAGALMSEESLGGGALHSLRV